MTKTRKDGSRGRLRIDYGDQRKPEAALKWLWRYVDAARTARELYGRGLVVMSAEQYAARMVVPASQRSGQCEEIPGYYATVRQDNRAVLGIVGERYRIVQNQKAFVFVDQLLGSSVHYETAGSLNGGRRVWVLATLPAHVEVGGDQVRPHVLLMNSQRMASHCLL